MRRIFLIVIITLIRLSGFAVLIIVQNQSTDQALQGEGNGRFHDYKRRITATNAATAEVFGNPDPVNHQAYGETTGVSGSPWTDRLRNVIEDGVRAIKNLPAIVGHRPAPPRRLAPPGVYFTLRYFSVHSPHGVRGILPGTKVVRVRDVGPSMLRVSAGETEFDAKAQDLTNDLDIADAASKTDAQSQKDVVDYLDQQRSIHQAQQDEQGRLLDQQQRDAAARINAAKASGYENPLERSPY